MTSPTAHGPGVLRNRRARRLSHGNGTHWANLATRQGRIPADTT